MILVNPECDINWGVLWRVKHGKSARTGHNTYRRTSCGLSFLRDIMYQWEPLASGKLNLARLVCTVKFQAKETAWSFNLKVVHGTHNPTK